MLGPAAYDVVSLLQDARIDVPEATELALFSRYIKARRAADATFDAADFAALYAILSAQRNTRLLGTFARLNRRDGKPQYLRHQPRIWTYLNRSLAHPALCLLRGLVCGERSTAASLNLRLVRQSPLPCGGPAEAHRPIWNGRSRHGDDGTAARAIVSPSSAAFPAHMMGIDGTWRRNCVMEDVSETGAKLTVDGSVEGPAPEGVLPAAVVDRAGLSPLRALLGQWRPDRRQLSQARRQEEKARRAPPPRPDFRGDPPSYGRHRPVD